MLWWSLHNFSAAAIAKCDDDGCVYPLFIINLLLVIAYLNTPQQQHTLEWLVIVETFM